MWPFSRYGDKYLKSLEGALGDRFEGTGFKVRHEFAHWREATEGGKPALGAPQTAAGLKSDEPGCSSRPAGLAPLPSRPEARPIKGFDYIHVTLDLPTPHRLMLRAASLQTGKSALDPAEFIRAVEIFEADAARIRPILASDALRATTIELLHGNAPYISELSFSGDRAEWVTVATDRLDTEMLRRALAAIKAIDRAVFEGRRA